MNRDSWLRIAVVGGGPAGCSAAIALAKSGIDVCVFEKGDQLRDKPCGDALTSLAVGLIDETFGLGESDLSRVGGVRFRGAVLRQPSGSLPVDSPALVGWSVRRSHLDQALRDCVSRFAEIKYRTQVVRLTPGNRFITASTAQGADSRFDAVILAGGAGDRFTRNLGIDGEPCLGFAVRRYVRENYADSHLVVEPTPKLLGYAWEFPNGHGTRNVGLCALAPVERSVLVSFVKPFAASTKSREAIGGGAGPCWSGSFVKRHLPVGVVSCGDAAGLVDPFTGEGISAAIRSGLLAADCVLRFVKDGRNEARLAEYSNRIHSIFSDAYRPSQARISFSTLCGLRGAESRIGAYLAEKNDSAE
jgi:flavin-dependent dehydrogenase